MLTYACSVVGRDRAGYPLSTSSEAAAAYGRGLHAVLRLDTGSAEAIASSVALDPTFALGHAALALLGHQRSAPVDVAARLRDARLHSRHATERERSHVYAIERHLHGGPTPLLAHLETYPLDALLLSTAVPTIAFAGVTEVPAEAWAIVERARPAYGDDWWFGGLLAYVRQEQGRYDEAMELSCRSLAVEPGAGRSAHARTHAHYETGDHTVGVAWIDAWMRGDGARMASPSHFAWHAALHELSLGDVAAVRRRYDEQLRPEPGPDCRALVDSGSLLFRWALTSESADVPSIAADITDVARVVGRDGLERPATPFLALHAAVTLLATDDAAGLRSLVSWASVHEHPAQREVVAPLARALGLMQAGDFSEAADALATLTEGVRRLGGSDAQREVVQETRIAALLRAGRLDEARLLLDTRLDRRPCPRDQSWLDSCARSFEP